MLSINNYVQSFKHILNFIMIFKMKNKLQTTESIYIENESHDTIMKISMRLMY